MSCQVLCWSKGTAWQCADLLVRSCAQNGVMACRGAGLTWAVVAADKDIAAAAATAGGAPHPDSKQEDPAEEEQRLVARLRWGLVGQVVGVAAPEERQLSDQV